MEAKKAKLDLSPTIIDLPNEILLKIFELLPQSDQYAVGLVSNHFQDLIDDIKLDIETAELFINENNVREVKEAIQNKKFCFKRINMDEVFSIEDLTYILQSIGKKIEYLSMTFTAAFNLLKCNVIYLKSLEICFDDGLKNSVNNGSFNLCFFTLLEELSFNLNNVREMHSTTKNLLVQLKSPKNTSSLKQFTLDFGKDTEDYSMDSLLHHASTLEILKLEYSSSVVENLKKWKITFSRLKNLKKIYLTGAFSLEMMNVIFSALPKETPLAHLELSAFDDLDCCEVITLIVEKWMNSLQYSKLNDLGQLTDDAVMELGKLHKLRVFKILRCDKITKMGLLAGIAIEKNIFMVELHLHDISNLDELGLRVMVSRFPNLRYLSLNNLSKAITNISLANIWRFSIRIRCLYIADCYNITDEGLIGFENYPYSITRLIGLVKLLLHNCRYLTDRTLIKGLQLPALRLLELCNCPKITLKGIESLVKTCPLLDILSLPSTVFINDNALFVIGNGLKHLRELNINDSDNLTEIVRDHIKACFTALQDSTFSSDCKLEFE